MKLKIINETAPLLGDTMLTSEVQKRISIGLDEIVKNLRGAVRTCNILQDIAALCDTPEELAFAIVLHLEWRQRNLIEIQIKINYLATQ